MELHIDVGQLVITYILVFFGKILDPEGFARLMKNNLMLQVLNCLLLQCVL